MIEKLAQHINLEIDFVDNTLGVAELVTIKDKEDNRTFPHYKGLAVIKRGLSTLYHRILSGPAFEDLPGGPQNQSQVITYEMRLVLTVSKGCVSDCFEEDKIALKINDAILKAQFVPFLINGQRIAITFNLQNNQLEREVTFEAENSNVERKAIPPSSHVYIYINYQVIVRTKIDCLC